MIKRKAAGDINTLAAECRSTSGALLLDVRRESEFAKGHIPGAVNIPVEEIERAEYEIDGLDTPVYVYCLSGARADRAKAELDQMGFTNVKAIGGIGSYTGELEK